MATILGEIARLFRGEIKSVSSHAKLDRAEDRKTRLTRLIHAAIVHRFDEALEEFLFEASQVGLEVAIEFDYFEQHQQGVMMDCTECDALPAIRTSMDDGNGSTISTFSLFEIENVQVFVSNAAQRTHAGATQCDEGATLSPAVPC